MSSVTIIHVLPLLVAFSKALSHSDDQKYTWRVSPSEWKCHIRAQPADMWHPILSCLVQALHIAILARQTDLAQRCRIRGSQTKVPINTALGARSGQPRFGTLTNQCAHKGLNNRIEGSHRPTRKPEKIKSACQAQKFLALHDETVKLCRPRRRKITATIYRQKRAAVFRQWNECADKLTT